MSDFPHAPPAASENAQQVTDWNGPRGEAWASQQVARDRGLNPFGEALLARAAVGPGERVIDVGCGAGTSSLALAAAVGPIGSVLGLDVSAPLLALARRRAAGIPQLRFVQADAATQPFAAEATLLFSRFGVMFFGDPLAAFTNLRRGLGNSGRLAFVCWRSLAENPWLQVPFEAGRDLLAAPTPPADAPGPLAFADQARVTALLTRAGFGELTFEPFDGRMPLGDGEGLEAAAQEAVANGPLGRLYAQAPPGEQAAVVRAVRAALAPHLRGTTLELPAAVWLVTGRAVVS